MKFLKKKKFCTVCVQILNKALGNEISRIFEFLFPIFRVDKTIFYKKLIVFLDTR